MTEYSALVTLLADRSAKIGEFTLASGKRSQFYIDARLTTMSPDGLKLIGGLGFSAIVNAAWEIDAVGGLTLGADPISYAISYASASTSHPLRAFSVRKEAKVHGTAKLIEGPVYEGDRVAVVEDVITTGDSALRAIAAARNANMIVIGVLALIDREEGGREAIERIGIPVLSLANAKDILSARKAQHRSSARPAL
jgi:orotate phosphoribosyltransferase